MTKTKTWKARRLEAKRRKRLTVQRETARLLRKHRVGSRWALMATERREQRKARRTRREQQAAMVAAWVAEGRCKPMAPPDR